MDGILEVNGNITALDSFVCPEMSLSSARSEMAKNVFSLSINAQALIKEMSKEYEDWMTESKDDDQMCGGPQDELAEAGYPPIVDLIKDPYLLELTFGYYLRKELFDKILPAKNSKIIYWFDEVTECEISGTNIIFKGICYSRKKPNKAN